MRYIFNDNTLTHWGIPGMRWGVRRYRDENGKLTALGEKRYAKAIQRNNQKPKNKRVGKEDLEDLKDPEAWAKADYEAARNVASSSKNVVDTIGNSNFMNSRGKKNPRLDLSGKTDKELRDAINRELLERQYNDVFNAPKTSRGKEVIKKVLAGTGAALGLASAATSVALGIHTLKYGG